METRAAWSTSVVPEAVSAVADPRDRALAAHLAYDVERWRGSLDTILSAVVSRPLDEVEPGLLRVLRLGTLQLWRTQVPDHAAVTTSVDLARHQVPPGRADGAGGFVNGVLRSVARGLADGSLPPAQVDDLDRMALATGHPRWIVEDLVARLGEERAESVLAAASEPAGVTLRSVVPRQQLLDELAASGVEAAAGEHAAESVHLPGGVDPRSLAAVVEGRARPQDEASMLVVHAARVAPGDRVLDLCAGPGGKTTHLATLAGDTGHVVAVELHEHRARAVGAAARRLGVEVDVRVGDAAEPPLDPEDRFDVVLVDAPCTGLGTGRRRPEVRWRRQPSDVASLATVQRRLLGAAGRWVAPGGRLVYAVCTWTRGETEEVVAAALPDGFRVVETRLLLPDRDGTDGMFIAVAERAASDSSGSGDAPG